MSDEGPIGPFRGEYSFLSNFYPARVDWAGLMYPTLEHAYQAAKTLDAHDRHAISRMSSPGEAKRYGRQVKVQPDWHRSKRAVMAELLTRKFQDETLRAALLATGDRELVEYNTWGDTYWGIYNGRGQNWLGRLLMQVREELRGVPW